MKHRLHRRIAWHPAVAAILFASGLYTTYSAGPSVLRVCAVVACGLWFIGALYDFFTGHRLLDWMYGKPESDLDPESRKLTPQQQAELEHEQAWYEHKSKLMERSLGREHDMVMHAMIPYSIGGALDLYYFPNGTSGTAIATKELSIAPEQGSSNREYKTYELVMFTRHPLTLDAARDDNHPFGRAHRNINSILNLIARYSEQAQLNPNETCEFPPDMDRVGGKCLVFVGYAKHNDDMARDFGLLALIEVHPSEMQFARENGTDQLLARLKSAGHYPFSDLDREPVA